MGRTLSSPSEDDVPSYAEAMASARPSFPSDDDKANCWLEATHLYQQLDAVVASLLSANITIVEAHCILVPADAVSPSATLCAADYHDPHHLVQVIRVPPSETSPAWRRNEPLARALARGLPHDNVADCVEELARRFAHVRRGAGGSRETTGGEGGVGAARETQLWQRGLPVEISAREAPFRRETDLGLFETEGGFAIVLKIRRPAGRRDDADVADYERYI